MKIQLTKRKESSGKGGGEIELVLKTTESRLSCLYTIQIEILNSLSWSGTQEGGLMGDKHLGITRVRDAFLCSIQEDGLRIRSKLSHHHLWQATQVL